MPAGTTEGGSPSQLSVIREEATDAGSDYQQVLLAAWREVEGSEDLEAELEQLESTESQQLIFAAVEQAAAGMGRRPQEWPEHLELAQQRQVIHEACHYYLRGVEPDGYATMEEEDDAGKHLELYLDPTVSEAFISAKAAVDDVHGASQDAAAGDKISGADHVRPQRLHLGQDSGHQAQH